MKRTEIMPMMVRAIKDRMPLAAVNYYLMWKDGKIQCVGKTQGMPPEIIFARLTIVEIDKGFTALQWQSFCEVIANFLKQKGELQ